MGEEINWADDLKAHGIGREFDWRDYLSGLSESNLQALRLLAEGRSRAKLSTGKADKTVLQRDMGKLDPVYSFQIEIPSNVTFPPEEPVDWRGELRADPYRSLLKIRREDYLINSRIPNLEPLDAPRHLPIGHDWKHPTEISSELRRTDKFRYQPPIKPKKYLDEPLVTWATAGLRHPDMPNEFRIIEILNEKYPIDNRYNRVDEIIPPNYKLQARRLAEVGILEDSRFIRPNAEAWGLIDAVKGLGLTPEQARALASLGRIPGREDETRIERRNPSGDRNLSDYLNPIRSNNPLKSTRIDDERYPFSDRRDWATASLRHPSLEGLTPEEPDRNLLDLSKIISEYRNSLEFKSTMVKWLEYLGIDSRMRAAFTDSKYVAQETERVRALARQYPHSGAPQSLESAARQIYEREVAPALARIYMGITDLVKHSQPFFATKPAAPPTAQENLMRALRATGREPETVPFRYQELLQLFREDKGLRNAYVAAVVSAVQGPKSAP